MTILATEGAGRPAAALKALVVDDELVNRMVLVAMLRAQGFDTIEAENGEQACAVCAEVVPDFIFMDILMPKMDGFEATQRIKKMLGSAFVPVLFLTAISEESQLRRCIEVGGDDFLSKPYSRILLEAKIAASLRVRGMNLDLAAQRDELTDYRDHQQRDMAVAKRILDNVATREELAVGNVRYLLQPMELLNGDIILAATGHGLPAAIGAMTVHGVFMSMVAKGLGVEEIARELNRKMCELLPVERFLSAAILELHNETGLFKVWNGGMPDILVRNAEGTSISRFRSVNLPLGIVSPETYRSTTASGALKPGDQVLVYSDGLTEAHNRAADLFGDARLQAVFAQPGDPDQLFDRLLASLAEHVQAAPQSDDVSILYVRCDPDLPSAKRASGPATVTQPPGHWDFSIVLDAAALKRSEPVATVIQVMETVQGLGALRTPLFMVLTELFSNALEHGLLGLASDIKQRPNGFFEYYAARQQRLDALEEASLSIACQHLPAADGGRLTVRLLHNGAGFDPAGLPSSQGVSTQLKGRGIRLVRSLCESLEYRDGGREAIAVYRWAGAPASA